MLKALMERVRHYRTTVAGVCMILGSVITFIAQWATTGSVPDSTHWNILGAGLTAGAGFIAAADAKTTSKQVDKLKVEIEGVKEDAQR